MRANADETKLKILLARDTLLFDRFNIYLFITFDIYRCVNILYVYVRRERRERNKILKRIYYQKHIEKAFYINITSLILGKGYKLITMFLFNYEI